MTGISLCGDFGTVHDQIPYCGGMDNLVGLTVTAGRSWLVYPDGTNLLVTPVTELVEKIIAEEIDKRGLQDHN